jgi:hypothetical protein
MIPVSHRCHANKPPFSLQIQEADTPGTQAKAPSSDDISLQFYNTTAAGIGKNILMGTASRCGQPVAREGRHDGVLLMSAPACAINSSCSCTLVLLSESSIRCCQTG